jgi:MFS family permease
VQDLEAHFHADATAGAAVLALFYFPLGISSLAWGPACDVWGRKSIYLASTAMFAAASFGCIFAQNMAMLLAFRALQGVACEHLTRLFRTGSLSGAGHGPCCMAWFGSGDQA